jgi:Rps23 Pro-64 3,4-dihydroxylase Tpa1-like proline 4-hydroxylase
MVVGSGCRLTKMGRNMSSRGRILQSVAVDPASARAPVEDHIVIRGKTLPLDTLLRKDLNDEKLTASLSTAFRNADPFEHVVIDDLFDERLLDLIHEEFEIPDWQLFENCRQSTFRNYSTKKFGPATQLYLNLINSATFTEYLSALTGIDNLIVDNTALGGGLHETRTGGRFGVHRDFNFHWKNMLANRLVLITYLNRDWDDSFGGVLELWDGRDRKCVRSIKPVFGRTVIFRHSDSSFHGNPAPLNAPADRPRRSIAAYYYVHDHSDVILPFWRSSTFQDRTLTRAQKAKMIARNFVPPALWTAARHAWRRSRTRRNRAG